MQVAAAELEDRMKIAHIVGYFQPRLGYQEFHLATFQREMGHEVWVVTSDRYFPFPDYEATVGRVLGNRHVGVGSFEERGIPVRRLPCLYEHAANSFIVLQGLKAWLEELQPDVVHCHGVFGFTAHLMAVHKKRLGYRLVYDTHAADYNTNLHDTWLKRLYWSVFVRTMARRICGEADAIVAIGTAEQEFACRELRLPRDQVPVIHLGADVIRFRFDQCRRAAVRESLGVGERDTLVVYAGKLTPGKDVHVLLEAMAPLMRNMRRLKLLIVGAGSEAYLHRLRALAGKSEAGRRVVFYGLVPHADLPSLLCGGDIGVWPGDPSIAIQEAMACNLPVILPEYIVEGQTSSHLLANDNGLSFQRGDSCELGEQIQKLAADRLLRQAMGQRSRELVEARFSWDGIADDFLSMYRLPPGLPHLAVTDSGRQEWERRRKVVLHQPTGPIPGPATGDATPHGEGKGGS